MSGIEGVFCTQWNIRNLTLCESQNGHHNTGYLVFLSIDKYEEHTSKSCEIGEIVGLLRCWFIEMLDYRGPLCEDGQYFNNIAKLQFFQQ